MEYVIIKYNFYNDYLYSNDFLEIFNKRKNIILKINIILNSVMMN